MFQLTNLWWYPDLVLFLLPFYLTHSINYLLYLPIPPSHSAIHRYSNSAVADSRDTTNTTTSLHCHYCSLKPLLPTDLRSRNRTQVHVLQGLPPRTAGSPLVQGRPKPLSFFRQWQWFPPYRCRGQSSHRSRTASADGANEGRVKLKDLLFPRTYFILAATYAPDIAPNTSHD